MQKTNIGYRNKDRSGATIGLATGRLNGFLLVIDPLTRCSGTEHNLCNLESSVVTPGEGTGLELKTG